MFETAMPMTRMEMNLSIKRYRRWLFSASSMITAIAHKIREAEFRGCSEYCCQKPVPRNPNFQLNRPVIPKDSTMVMAMFWMAPSIDRFAVFVVLLSFNLLLRLA